MGFRSSIFAALVIFNALPIYALIRSVRAWVRPANRALVLWASLAAVVLINLPITIFWFREIYDHLYDFPSNFLRTIFVPTVAWQSSAVLFTLLLGPVYLLWVIGVSLSGVYLRLRAKPQESEQATHAEDAQTFVGSHTISRRTLLTRGPGLIVPALTVGLTGKVFLEDEVDVTPQITIPIDRLPPALDGMTIVQLSDLHAGPYIRRKEIEHWVSLANGLKPDLVVLTGDMIDRSLDSLPDLLEGLKGLRASTRSGFTEGAPLGVIAILGNHDLSSDPLSSRGELQGGESIATAMRSLGIRTLRNESIFMSPNGLSERVEPSGNNLAILGMDWIRRRDGRDFFAYHSVETRQRLEEITGAVEPGTPAVLLAHHPDTFTEVQELAARFPIGLTLSGHTHGGGQVVFFEWGGHTYGLTSVQFQYVSGLFRKNGCSLYVNRGLGYFGVPIRINCPPELSYFKLVRAI